MSAMRQSSDDRRASGFTLVEVLIALALATLIVATVYGTYFALIKGREEADSGMEARRELRSTLDLLRRELDAVYYTRSNKGLHFAVADRDIFGKPASSLAFTALAPPQAGGLTVSDQQEIGYEVLERDNRLLLTRRAKDRYLTADAARYPQMESLEGFLVECLNGDRWVKSWDTAINNGLPQAIRVTVTVKEGEQLASYSILAVPRCAP